MLHSAQCFKKDPRKWLTLTRDLRQPQNRKRPYICQNSFHPTSSSWSCGGSAQQHSWFQEEADEELFLVMDRKKSFSHMASSLCVPRSLSDLIMHIRGVKHTEGESRDPTSMPLRYPCHRSMKHPGEQCNQ